MSATIVSNWFLTEIKYEKKSDPEKNRKHELFTGEEYIIYRRSQECRKLEKKC